MGNDYLRERLLLSDKRLLLTPHGERLLTLGGFVVEAAAVS